MSATRACAPAALLVAAALLAAAVDATFDVGDLHYEGEACYHLRWRRMGTCVYLDKCPTVYADLAQLVLPQVCGFSSGRGLVPNVCCTGIRPAVARPPFGANAVARPNFSPATPRPDFSPLPIPASPSRPSSASSSFAAGGSSPFSSAPSTGLFAASASSAFNNRPPTFAGPSASTFGGSPAPNRPAASSGSSSAFSRPSMMSFGAPPADEEVIAFEGPSSASSSASSSGSSMTFNGPEDAIAFEGPSSSGSSPAFGDPPSFNRPAFSASPPRPATTTTTTTTTTESVPEWPWTEAAPSPPTRPPAPPRTTTRRPVVQLLGQGMEEQSQEQDVDFQFPDRGLKTTTTTTPRSTTASTTTPRSTTPRRTTTTPRTTTARRTTTTTSTTTPRSTTPARTTTKRTTAPRRTTTPRPTTTTTPSTTTTPTTTTTARTTTTRRPTMATPRPRPAVGRGVCFAGDAESEDGDGQATAVITLWRDPSGPTSQGAVDLLGESLFQENVEPAPAMAACSADEGCGDWGTARWRRERSAAGNGYPLAVDEQVRLRLSTVRSGRLFVGLCSEAGGVGCAVIAVLGTAGPGLRYETRLTATQDVADPAARVVAKAGAGTDALPSGRRFTLVLHRRSEGELAAWLDGRASEKASVALQPGMAFLRVASPAGNVTYVQGQEADGYHMDVGERVTVRLDVTRDGLLDVGLCGDRGCGVVRITGVEDGTMGWSSRITTTNSVTEERGQALQLASGPGSFPVGRGFSFVVLRRTEWAMDVWLEGDAERKATVPLEPDRLRLKVDSDAGQTALVRGEASDGFTLPPGKRVLLEMAPDAADGVLDVALCDAAACGVVRVVGVQPDEGLLAFSTRTTDTNNPSGDGQEVAEESEDGAGFPRGRTVRLAVRHVDTGTALQLQVALEGVADEDKTAVVDLPSSVLGATRLKIASSVGPVKLVQVLTDGHDMAVDEMVILALTVTKEDGWMFLGLCSETSCSAMGVIGADDNRFSFTSRVTTSNSVVGEGEVWQSQTRGPRAFVAGATLRFVVHRRTETLMDVWLEPAPFKKVTIPLEADRQILKAATDAGTLEYIADGTGSLVDRGYRLAVAEEVRVQVRPAAKQGWLFLGLCGAASCSTLGVGGADAQGRLATAVRASSANSVLAPGPVLEESSGPDAFVADEAVTLLVRRASELQLSVKVEGGRELALPLEPDQDTLDVVSAVGPTALLPGKAVDGYPVAVDEKVRLRFLPARAGAWLALGLCDAQACSAVRLTAASPLSYTARITRGNSVADERGDVVAEAAGAPSFAAGRNYTFVLHRHSQRAMDVWLEGEPGLKVAVALQPGRNVFKADSNAGHTYLDTRGPVDGWAMSVGDMLWMSLSASFADGRLFLGLCGEDSCSVVRVRGADSTTMGFSTAVVATNSVSGRGSGLQEPAGPIGFTVGKQHVFVVRRASADVLEVWLETDPENKASVPTTSADNDRLKVTSTAGTTTFVKGREWLSEDAAAALTSPSLAAAAAPGAKLCVELHYMAPSPDQTITLGAMEEGGARTTLAELATDQAATWRRRTVLTAVPGPLASSAWTLTVSSTPGVRIRSVSRCLLDKQKRVVVASAAARSRRHDGKARRPLRQAPDSCANGGQVDSTAQCACPAGFAGRTCEAGCPAGKFGSRCELQCPGGSCQGTLLCVSGLYCACAPGYRGDRCDQVCSTGDADCSFPCDPRQR